MFSKDGYTTVVLIVIIVRITYIDADVWCLNGLVVMFDGRALWREFESDVEDAVIQRPIDQVFAGVR